MVTAAQTQLKQDIKKHRGTPVDNLEKTAFFKWV